MGSDPPASATATRFVSCARVERSPITYVETSDVTKLLSLFAIPADFRYVRTTLTVKPARTNRCRERPTIITRLKRSTTSARNGSRRIARFSASIRRDRTCPTGCFGLFRVSSTDVREPLRLCPNRGTGSTSSPKFETDTPVSSVPAQ